MTLSFTTSNRLWLFRQTLATLIVKVKDLNLITHVLVVDDGSTNEGVRIMSELLKSAFPKQKLSILTRPSPGGHPQSMQRWFENVTTEFVFHCEDDWRFTIAGYPISSALDILNGGPQIGQVAIAKIPLESISPAETQSGMKYYKFIYNGALRFKPRVPGSWPHFTLNPSIIRFEAIRKVGNFIDQQRFEYAYAKRWVAAGFETSFLMESFAIHIGKGRSSYSINGMKR